MTDVHVNSTTYPRQPWALQGPAAVCHDSQYTALLRDLDSTDPLYNFEHWLGGVALQEDGFAARWRRCKTRQLAVATGRCAAYWV